MKTTIEIADDLAKQAKLLAKRRGTTLRGLIEQGIRTILKEDSCNKSFYLSDKSVSGDGLQPAFRDKSWSDIRDTAYEGRGG